MNIREKIGPEYAATQQIDVYTDTRDVLAHARRNAVKRGLQDWFVVDIDAHHVESVSWKEVVTYIEDPVIRDNAMRYQAERIGAPPYGLNGRSRLALPVGRWTHSASGRSARDRGGN